MNELFNFVGERPLASLGFLTAGSWAWIRFFEWVL